MESARFGADWDRVRINLKKRDEMAV